MNIQDAIQKGLERYLKNPHWKGIYDGAPADAKAYYDLHFSQMDGGRDDQDAYAKAMEEAYRGLTDEGWEYILDNTTNNMAKWGLHQAREKYQKK